MKLSRNKALLAASALIALPAAAGAKAQGHAAEHAGVAADLVLIDGRILTEDASRHTVEALAVKDGRIVYVGSDAGARRYIGKATRIEDAHGRLVLPGLVDAHIHPAGIVDVDDCNLDSKALSLDELVVFVKACMVKFHPGPGEWLAVQQWNFTEGNRPSADNPTLRAALTRVSADTPIELLGNDGHHGAVNSAALKTAKNAAGQVVGLSAATLRSDFADIRQLVGVDAQGEPNGTVNEEARDVLGAPDILAADFPLVMAKAEAMPERLNSVGITAIQDALVTPQIQALYDKLYGEGKLTVRADLTQFYVPELYRNGAGAIDYPKLVAMARATRAKYAHNPLIKSDAVKIFADGVLEGNPYAVPPTLPDSPSLHPYLQPIFGTGPNPGDVGRMTVKGYVDTGSALCAAAREGKNSDGSPLDGAAFLKANGFVPAQCAISSGKFQHARDVLMDYTRAMHDAGFTLHIHAIGDAAVHAAVDAIEAARASDGTISRPDTIAHLQVVSPEDIARIGKDHLYLAYTYSWANADPDYDLSVVPFFTKVSGTAYKDFHNPDTYYEKAFYPTLSTKKAGAILVAGSDAPVNTRDPQPFVNMQLGVTRAEPGLSPANPWERLNIRDLIDAYTINGAHALGRADEIGSIETGKSADFIVLDRDIVALADKDKAGKIGATKVLETWFRGRKVWPLTGGN